MEQSPRALIEGLTDSQAVGLVNAFAREVFGEAARPSVIEQIGALESTSPMVGVIIEQHLHEQEAALDPAQSAAAARLLLSMIADDEHLGPALMVVWEHDRGQLSPDFIMSMGLAASMFLFVATVHLDLVIGGLHVRKPSASPELIKAVLEPFVKVLTGEKGTDAVKAPPQQST